MGARNGDTFAIDKEELETEDDEDPKVDARKAAFGSWSVSATGGMEPPTRYNRSSRACFSLSCWRERCGAAVMLLSAETSGEESSSLASYSQRILRDTASRSSRKSTTLHNVSSCGETGVATVVTWKPGEEEPTPPPSTEGLDGDATSVEDDGDEENDAEVKVEAEGREAAAMDTEGDSEGERPDVLWYSCLPSSREEAECSTTKVVGVARSEAVCGNEPLASSA